MSITSARAENTDSAAAIRGMTPWMASLLPLATRSLRAANSQEQGDHMLDATYEVDALR